MDLLPPPPAEKKAASLRRQRRPLRTGLFIIAGCVLLMVIGGFIVWMRLGSSSTPAAKTINVAVIKITRRDLRDQQTFSGEFRPYQEIDLYAEVAGFVRTITVDIGDRVSRDQVLATLEIPELADEIHKAEAKLRHAQSEVKRSQADYDNSHILLRRLTSVSVQNPTLISQQDIDNATAKDSAAEAALNSAKNEYDVINAELDQLHTTKKLCQITAPFSGVVTKRYADAGSFIRGGESPSSPAIPLIRLSQNSLMRLIFPIPERISALAHAGLPVSISIGALGAKLQEKITRIQGRIDADTRTMNVEIDLPNDDLKIIPGMYADTTIVTREIPHTIAIPVMAVSQNGAKATVMVIDQENHGSERQVTLGLETPTLIEVTSGLDEGDLVVLGSRPSISSATVFSPHVIDDQDFSTPTPGGTP